MRVTDVNIRNADGDVVGKLVTAESWFRHDDPLAVGLTRRVPPGGSLVFADTGRQVSVSCACCVRFGLLSRARPGHGGWLECELCVTDRCVHGGGRWYDRGSPERVGSS